MLKAFVFLIVTLGLACQRAQATPSGLNNTATADTMDKGHGAIQTFGVFSQSVAPNYFAGVKVGLQPFEVVNLELGVDAHLSPTPSGPVVFQAKASRWTFTGGPNIAVGVANFSLGDKDRTLAGSTAGYLVATQSLQDVLRLHAGFQLQSNNNAFFAGADKTFTLGGRNFTVCADATQSSNRTEWLLAPGVKYAVLDRLVLETWMSYATSAKKVSGVLKIDFIVD